MKILNKVWARDNTGTWHVVVSIFPQTGQTICRTKREVSDFKWCERPSEARSLTCKDCTEAKRER